jgi:hypothetical protein
MAEFRVTIDDTERVFTLAPMSLKVDAMMRRFNVDANDPEISVAKLVDFIAYDENRINEFMNTTYRGNHDGLNWFTDTEYDDMSVAIGFFLMTFYGTKEAKPQEPKKSSGSTATNSRAKAPTKARETRSATKTKLGR